VLSDRQVTTQRGRSTAASWTRLFSWTTVSPIRFGGGDGHRGWLRNLGLGQYESAFRDNEIDGEVLPNLTADDLKDLGVAIVGHRRKLLTAIAELLA
jgi:hypothetical protein